jgi:hypothetical protein
MSFRSLPQRLLLSTFALFISIAFCAAGEAPPANPQAQTVPVVVPEWAVAAVAVRNLGRGLDGVVAYANRIIPNSGELARQIVVNKLFKIRMNAAIKADAPALIYLLDPLATQLTGETAFLMPVTDAAAMKKSLSEIYDPPTEEAGVLHFTVLQKLPLPDTALFVKFQNDSMLAAPTMDILKKLETLTVGRTLEALAGKAPSDATLTLRPGRLALAYGPMLEMAIPLATQMLQQPGAEAEILTQTQRLLKFLPEVETLDVQVGVDAHDPAKPTAALEFQVHPLTGSKLAERMATDAPAINGALLKLLPARPPLSVVWNMNGAPLAKRGRALLAQIPLNNAEEKTTAAMLGEFMTVLEMCSGDAAIALSPSGEGASLVLAFQTAQAGQVTPALIESVLKKSAEAVNAIAIAESGGVIKQNVLSIKAQPATKQGDIEIHSHVMAVPDILSDEETALLQKSVGWPLTLQSAVAGRNVALCVGKNAPEALQAALASHLAGAGDGLEKFADAGRIQLRPIAALKLVMGIFLRDFGVDPERMTARLSDDPVSFSARRSGGVLSLRVELPASVPESLFQLWQRVRRANIDLDTLFGGGGDAGVPPPAPAP